MNIQLPGVFDAYLRKLSSGESLKETRSIMVENLRGQTWPTGMLTSSDLPSDLRKMSLKLRESVKLDHLYAIRTMTPFCSTPTSLVAGYRANDAKSTRIFGCNRVTEVQEK